MSVTGFDIEQCMDDETKAAIQALLDDQDFRKALASLTAEVLDACTHFEETHGHLLDKHLTTGDQGEYTLALALGWVLGLGAGDLQTVEQPREIRLAQLLLVAALGAGSAAGISTRMQKWGVH